MAENPKIAANENFMDTSATGSAALHAEDKDIAMSTVEDNNLILNLKAPSNDSQATSKQQTFLEEAIDLNCLLLADSTNDSLPLHFRQLLLHYDTTKMLSAELLFLLIYTVALETGFVTQIEYASLGKNLHKIPATSSFHAKNILQIVRVAPTFSHNTDKSYFSMHLSSLLKRQIQPLLLHSLLTAIVTGDLMICTLTPHSSTDLKGSSICLSIGRYLLCQQPKGKPRQYRFSKLDELSLLLRNNMFIPVRQRQLGLIDAESVYPALQALPTELYDTIFQYLNKNQLKIAANVCKRFNDLIINSRHYKKLTQRLRRNDQFSHHIFGRNLDL